MTTLPPALAPVVIAAVLVSASLALIVGFWQKSKTRRLSDLIPLRREREAAVRNGAEFSSTTVAATISLATLLMAYFELAGVFGPWLFWTVATTTCGLLAVRFVAPRIAARLERYGSRIPTLHEFIGVEFDSRLLTVTGAVATSLGYLGAYAVELTVGSRLFANMVPSMPAWVAVIVLATIGFTYTAAGGFRAVVLTDRMQMVTIWLFIAAIGMFYWLTLTHGQGIATSWQHLPVPARSFGWRDGLGAFLLGVFFINVPSYVSDIGTWQRVSSTRDRTQLRAGLSRSAVLASLSWGLLAILAILAPAVTKPYGDIHPVAALMATIAASPGVLASMILFIGVAGLYAAMMSTASTMLVAVAHTVFEDVLSRDRHLTDDERADSSKTLNSARIVLVLAAIAAVVVVELLSYLNFTIADFVFAIYGAQLALFPPVCAALYLPRERLRKSSRWAAAAIGLGFTSVWSIALYGKLFHADTAVYLAPVVGLLVSGVLLVLGLAASRDNGELTA